MSRNSEAPVGISTAEALVVAAMTLAGGALRFYHLGVKSLWYDEAVIYHVVQGSFRAILTQNALENSAPPLYALLLGLVTGPDASEAVLRGLSALAGTAAIPLCYLLAREFLPARSAWLVPLLVAVAPVQIIYSQQLREYSLTTASAAFLLLAYARFVRAPDRRNAAWIASAAVLGLLTQYGMGLLLTALNLVCILAFLGSGQPIATYRRWFLTQLPAAAVAVVLYLTVVRYQAAVVGEAGLGYLKPYYWDGTTPGFLELLMSQEHDIVAYALPGLLPLILWAIGLLACVFVARSRLAAAFFLVPVAVTVLAAIVGVYPYGAIRQDIFLTPMVYVGVVLGVDWLLAVLPRRLPAAVSYGVAAVLAVALALPALPADINLLSQPLGFQPMRSVVGTLGERLRPNETIYVYFNAIPAFRYYWRHHEEPWIPGALHRSFMDEHKAAGQMAIVQDELRDLSRRGQPYWVVLSHLATADENWLLESLERYATVNLVEGASGSSLLRVTPVPGRF